MSVKSIIDIDVNDAAFKEFAARFAKYQEMVKKLPGFWKESEKASDGMADNFASMTAALMAQNDAAKSLNRQYSTASRTTRSMVHDTAQVAKNIGGATLNLLKWVGIGGVLGGAGLFGIGSLAGAVGNQRRSALGLGISTGQQAAFGVSYNRYVDTASMLGNIANAKSDWSKQWVFGAMGVNPEGRNPADLGVDMMTRAKEIFDKSGQSEQEAKAAGLLEIFSMEDLRRLHNTTMQELRGREGNYRGSVAGMSRNDRISQNWQDFSDRLRQSGYEIQNLIVEKLGGKVVPALDKLSRSAVSALEKLFDNGGFDKAIDSIGTGIEKFAEYVGSPEFAQKIKEFTDDITAIAEAIHRALVFFRLIPDTPAPVSLSNLNSMPISQGSFLRSMMTEGPKWSPVAASGIAANISAESGFNPFAQGDWNASRRQYDAYGLAQWHADRQAEYARVFGHTMQSVRDRDAAQREQTAFINYELTQGKYKNVGDRLSSETSAVDAGVNVSRMYERPRDPLGSVGYGRGRTAQQILVTIQNAPGNSASASVAQVAQ